MAFFERRIFGGNPMNNGFEKLLMDRIRKLDGWLTEKNWKAFDPFDGLNADTPNFFTFDNHYLRIALQQTVRRFPVNLRPILGIKPETSSKGMGFCALGYLKLHQATGEKKYLDKATACLDWLTENFSTGYSGCCWGNHFSYESRGGRIPFGVPTIVWTSLIANVFLYAYEYTNEKKYFDIASSAGDFIVSDIPRLESADGTVCLMYTPKNKIIPNGGGDIHNSNVLGAWLLARLFRHTKKDDLLNLSTRAVEYTLNRQLPKGGWYYGEPKKFRWIDSFHTGYVLESIHGYIKAVGGDSKKDKLVKGYRYFISTFFESDGTPRYYDYKTYPIDIQCAGQGIQTLVNLREYDDRSMDVANKLALWTIKNMQDPQGYFYFRKYPAITNKTPMFHWGQATMLSGLAHLFAAS